MGSRSKLLTWSRLREMASTRFLFAFFSIFSLLLAQEVGPRRRLVRRRKNLPPAPQQQVLTQPQPQLPQKLLATELSNESQHFKAETRLIRQKVKRKKRPSYVGAGGGKH